MWKKLIELRPIQIYLTKSLQNLNHHPLIHTKLYIARVNLLSVYSANFTLNWIFKNDII